jgi:hypothetical protein
MNHADIVRAYYAAWTADDRDGLICEWRDYFDLQTVLKQLVLLLDGSRPPQAKDQAAGSRG